VPTPGRDERIHQVTARVLLVFGKTED
jgi:hypothetical protein